MSTKVCFKDLCVIKPGVRAVHQKKKTFYEMLRVQGCGSILFRIRIIDPALENQKTDPDLSTWPKISDPNDFGKKNRYFPDSFKVFLFFLYI